MKYSVLLTRDAESDLSDIYDYISETDSFERADAVLESLREVLMSLSRFPERGAYPHELQELGVREFRQVLSKPHRILYRVVEKQVIVFLIADGRRDMQTLLMRRLLEK
jgi:toxin ParE1/3/4